MLGKKVLAVIVVNGRVYGHKGVVTKVKNRWFRKPVYTIDGIHKTTQIVREVDE